MLSLRKTKKSNFLLLKPLTCGQLVEQKNSSNSSNNNRNGTRHLTMAALAGASLVVGSGVVLSYSYMDPQFRTTIENKLPATAPLFKAVLGENAKLQPISVPSSSFPIKPLENSKKPQSIREKVASEGGKTVTTTTTTTTTSTLKSTNEEKEKSLKSSSLNSQKSSSIEMIGSAERARSLSPARTENKAIMERSSTAQKAVSSEAVTEKLVKVPHDRNKTAVKVGSAATFNPYLGKEDAPKKNQALEEHLKTAIATAESRVRAATNAKLETIRAVEHHVQTIREAIEAGPSGDWDEVVRAHAAAERKTREDIDAEKEGRRKVDQLMKVVNLGAQGETTVLHPLLAIARETAAKLSTEMDEMESMIKKIDTERVFVRDYGHLVEEGRKKFVKELRAVMPNADWSCDIDNMKHEQLRALLAHAHLRVDQLSRQLIEHKMTEEKRIREQIENLKVEKVKEVVIEKTLPSPKVDEEVNRIKDDFDKELQKRLKEAQEKYEKQLQEVVMTQKKLYDIEHAKDIETAVLAERAVHAASIGKALAELSGIEAALQSRAIQDVENRRAKQMWLAVHNLVESVEFGRKSGCCMEGRRLPLDSQLKVLMRNADGDAFMKTVNAAVAKTTRVRGEYTSEDLRNRFDKVFRIGHRVAALDENGGGVVAHLVSWLRSCLRFQLPLTYSDKDRFDPTRATNAALLDRARYYVNKKQPLKAIKILQQTKGPTRRVAADYIADVRRHEEAMLLARLMLAHAAVTSIRSTY